MTELQAVLSYWNWTSLAWLALAGFLIVDVVVIGRRSGARRVLWFAAAAVFVLAYVSPIGVLADGALFSAHIIQHLLLLLIIPLCYLLSLPEQSRVLFPPTAHLSALLCAPQVGWLCGFGAMWFWHVPSLCHAAAQNAALGTVRDFSLLIAGTIFWWPVFSPERTRRLSPPMASAYLFSACLGCSLLGVYITFTPVTVCPIFAHMVDRLGVVGSFRDWGFTARADQQLGGLLMWVPPCLVYGGVILSLLRSWYSPSAQMLKHPACQVSPLSHMGKVNG